MFYEARQWFINIQNTSLVGRPPAAYAFINACVTFINDLSEPFERIEPQKARADDERALPHEDESAQDGRGGLLFSP